jgi:hypothetical protein
MYQRVHQGRLTEHKSQGSTFARSIPDGMNVQLWLPIASVTLAIADYRIFSVGQRCLNWGVLSKY